MLILKLYLELFFFFFMRMLELELIALNSVVSLIVEN